MEILPRSIRNVPKLREWAWVFDHWGIISNKERTSQLVGMIQGFGIDRHNSNWSVVEAYLKETLLVKERWKFRTATPDPVKDKQVASNPLSTHV